MRRCRLTAICLIAAGLIIVSFLWASAIFSHKTHLDADIECTTCHVKVEKSSSAADDNSPGNDVCKTCHDPAPEFSRSTSLKGELRFSHAWHLEKDIVCRTCHQVDTLQTDAPVPLPGMEVCISCHKERNQTEVCADCHTKPVHPQQKPKSHTKQWLYLHGEDAGRNERDCATCHTQSFCQDCHQGDNLKPKPHRRNWLYTHSIAARNGSLECTDCHEPTSETKCVACHKSPSGKPFSHKKAGWIARHPSDAGVNLAACATCHFDMGQDAVCTKCHKDE